MKLHTVFVTHNRLELTKQAISSYLETVTVPYSFVVVDNDSSDGTQEWLRQEHGSNIILLRENRYPGFATNLGWSFAPEDATHLQRADNDFAFLPDWCWRVREAFTSYRLIGQVGLRTDEEELYAKYNVGGNNVIRRKLWTLGLRYDERPWTDREAYPPGFSEDSYFSPAVRALGYKWRRVSEPCIVSLASGDWSDEYYQRSYGDRAITP